MNSKSSKDYQTPSIQKLHLEECLMENWSEKQGHLSKEHAIPETEDGDGASSSPWED